MTSISLWENNDADLINQVSNPITYNDNSIKEKLSSKNISINEKLTIIKERVYKVLGSHIDDTLVIREEKDLDNYINECIKSGFVALDTETNNSLDPITCKLMGLCLYCKNQKQVYIPVNHTNMFTNERLSKQLDEKTINKYINKLIENNVKIITHNGKFDYEVIKCTCNVEFPIYWDTLIAGKILDENEQSYGLKNQYIDKINKEQEKYSIEGLFENIEYAIVEPELFSLYAATDSRMTYDLYLWQKERFDKDSDLYEILLNVEIPTIKVLAEMELSGMSIDREYSSRLSKVKNDELKEIDFEISKELEKLQSSIDSWRLTENANIKVNGKKSKNEQLSQPINLASPTQLAILFYDVLKCPVVNNEKPRGTGEDEINKLYEKMNMPIFNLLIKRREIVKLITGYVDVIPELSKRWEDGRVRTHFNQYGAATGRLSSSDPINFQNIPAQEKSIRLMFRAPIVYNNIKLNNKQIVIDETDDILLNNDWIEVENLKINDVYNEFTIRDIVKDNKKYIITVDNEKQQEFKIRTEYRIVGADYSAQEPRLCAEHSQDENMINAYLEGKDLYSVVASLSFKRKYEDCLEFYSEGTILNIDGKEVVCGYKTHKNKDGAKYRTQAKSVLLGLLYGRQSASIGEQLGLSKNEAQELINNFFKSFPKVKKWIDNCINNAKKTGYVEGIGHRRRRLPDIILPEFEFKSKENKIEKVNPFLYCEDYVDKEYLNKVNKYKTKLKDIKWNSDFEKIKSEALKENIIISSNTFNISRAERQAVNAVIQGGAATITKCALIDILNDERIREIKGKLINSVHDEILIEVPKVYAKLGEKYLSENMINSAKRYVKKVPMKTDTYNVSNWYFDEMSVIINKKFNELIDLGLSREESLEKTINNFKMLSQEQIEKMLNN